jgi:hypothetical protein
VNPGTYALVIIVGTAVVVALVIRGFDAIAKALFNSSPTPVREPDVDDSTPDATARGGGA